MGLHIVVCLKAVIAQASSPTDERTAEQCELNPFDRPALALAHRLVERHGGSITALSMGPRTCDFALFEALARGAQRGVMLCDAALKGADTLATSTALAAALEKLGPFDLVLFGTQTADSDAGQVGPQTAVALDLPMVTWVTGIEYSDGKLRVERLADGFCEQFELSWPAALTVHSSAAEPTEPELGAIEQAFGASTVEIWSLEQLGLAPEQVGETGSPTRVLTIDPLNQRKVCSFIEGSTDDQIETLVEQLKTRGNWG